MVGAVPLDYVELITAMDEKADVALFYKQSVAIGLRNTGKDCSSRGQEDM